MKNIHSILAILIITAAFSFAAFSQVSNDSDGDGIPNSEDVCPNDKGTKANKGCPEKTAKPTPTSESNTQTVANKCVSGDCINGRGKMVYANGNIYEGDFIDGRADGRGTINFPDRAIYIGQFSKDFFHGKGKYAYPDGGFYDGNWVNGKIEGKGRITFSDGNSYEGDFSNGKKDGQGVFKFKDGRIYTGLFSNDFINGKGKMIFADGGIYDGNWVNGVREGQGTYTAKDGSYASGEWKNDKLNGFGKDYNKATNIIREGTYKDHVFIGEPAKIPTPIQGNQKPFPGCNFVLEDAACKSFFGFSEGKVRSIIGADDSYGEYYKYGVRIGYVPELSNITFYGIKPSSKYLSNFNGKPSRNFDWGVSMDEVIRKYGKPQQQSASKINGKKIIEIYYDTNPLPGLEIRFGFEDKKLAEIELRATETDRQNYQASITAAQNWLQIGFKQDTEKKNEDAIKSYSECIRMDPHKAVCYEARGRVFERLNQNKEALADYNKVLQIYPNSITPRLSRGELYSKSEKYEEAITDFLKVIELNPKSAEGYRNLGNTYSDLGIKSGNTADYEKAVGYYTKSIELNPRSAIDYNLRGILYDILNNSTEAIADFSKSIELDPKSWEVFRLRALVYCQQGKKALAQADEKKIIELGGTVAEPCK